jgi:hypothetical protein
MTFIRHHRWLTFMAAIVLAFVLFTGSFGIYLADEAGKLPWQEDPTPISDSITPFADIPGFSAPTAVPTTEPASNSVSEPTSVPTDEEEPADDNELPPGY